MATPSVDRKEICQRIETCNRLYREGWSPPGKKMGNKGSVMAQAGREMGLSPGGVRRNIEAEVERRARGHSFGPCECETPATCMHYYLPDWYDNPALPPSGGFSVSELPSRDIPVDQYVDQLVQASDRRRENEAARYLIDVKIHDKKPIAIAHIGDLHLDSEATDWRAIKDVVDVIKTTDGMFCGSPGDIRDNWIGRLCVLKGSTPITDHMGWKLAEWLFAEIGNKFMYYSWGNHDDWCQENDPLEWIVREHAINIGDQDKHRTRLNLVFPNGREVRLHTRHRFMGHSQWDTAFGPAKEAQLGCRDHILVDGDQHISGYHPVKDPMSKIICHAIRVGTFKRLGDTFAKQKGFRDLDFSPIAITIIDPHAENETDLVTVRWGIKEAARQLEWMRSR